MALNWPFFFFVTFQALKQVRFLAENKDIYEVVNSIQQMDFPLSAQITDILQCYYGGYGG